MPRYVAARILRAPLDDVWSFLADPYNLGDWWPGISGVEPDRRGLAAGARWKVVGSSQPGYLRRPQASGTLVVLSVEPLVRLAFQLPRDRIEADITLEVAGEERTEVSLVVDAPFLSAVRRRFPAQALDRLSQRLETATDV